MSPCAACSGKCCKDDFGYRIKHMAAEFYTHVCDFCSEGDAVAVVAVKPTLAYGLVTLNAESSGIHPRYAARYQRRVSKA